MSSINFAQFQFFSNTPSPASVSHGAAARRGEERPLLARALAGLGHVLTRAAQNVAAGAERREVLTELARLSDRELADIGLTRGDVPRIFDPVFAARRSAARSEQIATLRSI